MRAAGDWTLGKVAEDLANCAPLFCGKKSLKVMNVQAEVSKPGVGGAAVSCLSRPIGGVGYSSPESELPQSATDQEAHIAETHWLTVLEVRGPRSSVSRYCAMFGLYLEKLFEMETH